MRHLIRPHRGVKGDVGETLELRAEDGLSAVSRDRKSGSGGGMGRSLGRCLQPGCYASVASYLRLGMRSLWTISSNMRSSKSKVFEEYVSEISPGPFDDVYQAALASLRGWGWWPRPDEEDPQLGAKDTSILGTTARPFEVNPKLWRVSPVSLLLPEKR